MLITNHVLSGALLGYVAPTVPVAFAVGLLSHVALDAVPHWGDPRPLGELLHVAVPDGLMGLAVMGTAAATAAPHRRARVVAAMFGATVLDADKPSSLFFGFSPFPRAVDRLHQHIQRESPRRMPQEVAVGVTGSVLVALAARRARGSDR